jgi:hypothetical protein
LVHRRYHCRYHREPDGHYDLYGYGNQCEWLYQNSHRYRDGESIAGCNGYAISCDDLRRSKQYDHSNGRRHLRLVHWRYYGCHHREPNGYNYLHGYRNEREWLYSQRNGYSNGESIAQRDCGCFSCDDLCRSEHYRNGNGRRHLCLVHWRYHSRYHREPDGHYDLYGYGNQCKWLYQNSHRYGNGESITGCNGYAIARDDLYRKQ